MNENTQESKPQKTEATELERKRLLENGWTRRRQAEAIMEAMRLLNENGYIVLEK